MQRTKKVSIAFAFVVAIIAAMVYFRRNPDIVPSGQIALLEYTKPPVQGINTERVCTLYCYMEPGVKYSGHQVKVYDRSQKEIKSITRSVPAPDTPTEVCINTSFETKDKVTYRIAPIILFRDKNGIEHAKSLPPVRYTTDFSHKDGGHHEFETDVASK